MPLNKNGSWTLDDRPMFTDKQWEKIQELIRQGKKEEAQALIDKILKAKEMDA